MERTLEGYGWATVESTGKPVRVPREVFVVRRDDCRCGNAEVEGQNFADGATKWWVRCEECDLVWYAVFVTDAAGNPVRER